MPRKKKKNQNRVELATQTKASSKESVSLSSANFPAKGSRQRPVKILPSHRLVFDEYKAQGFRHLGKAIRKTGVYSESVASRVNVLTKSKSWQALMQEYMPEEHLALRHAEILDKRDVRKVAKMDEKGVPVFDANGDPVMEDVDDGPNTAAVTKGLELAYRLRGSFTKEGAVPPSTVMYNLFYKPEVREQMKVFEEGIKQSLINEVTKKNQADADQEAARDAEGGA